MSGTAPSGLDGLAEAMFREDAAMDGVPADLIDEAWAVSDTVEIYRHKARMALIYIITHPEVLA